MPLHSKEQMKRLSELVEKGFFSKHTFDKMVKETPNIDKLPEKSEGFDDQMRIKTIRRVKNLSIIK